MGKSKKIEIHTSAIIEGMEDGDSYIEIVNGQFEKRFQQIFQRCLPQDVVAFDLGANIGVVSIILGKMFSEAKVFAFEAGSHVCEVLSRNIFNNYLSGVEAHQMAIANYDGEIQFVENSAYGHAVDSQEGAGGELVSVPCFTIDTLVQRFTPQRLDFIKLDIEGFEPQALEGAAWTIKNLDPIFLMEINPWCIENYGKVNAAEFVRKIYRDFRYVYIVNKDYSQDVPVKLIDVDELVEKFSDTENLFVDDLIFSNNPRVILATS